MCTTSYTEKFELILVFVVFSVFLVCSSVSAKNTNKDYFTIRTSQDRRLLRNVEKHHLSQKKFWKWYKAGKFSLALGELEFVLRYFPNHPKALQLLSSVALVSKKHSLAFPFFQNAINLYPQHALTHAQYGAHLVRMGLIEEGIVKLNAAINKNAKLVLGYVWLAQAYEKNGQSALARRAAEQAKVLGYQGQILDTD
jgi:predicted Zn-dependent protease